MIRGVHTMFYSSEPERPAAFLPDKLGFPATDLGEGWLIFDLPEADMGCHPADENEGAKSGTHDISFYCDNIEQTVAELQARGVEFTESSRGPGLWSRDVLPRSVRLPGAALSAEIRQVALESSRGFASGRRLKCRERILAIRSRSQAR